MNERSIRNKRTGKTILWDLKIANTFRARFFGYMGKKSIPEGQGLQIVPCNSIHCFFMRVPIDVIYLDKENRVLRILLGMKPWRIGPFVRGANSVIEARQGTFSGKVEDGDILHFDQRMD